MASSTQTRLQGRVKIWKAGKGYGFIARDGERDLFVHVTALPSNLRRLADGGQLEGTEVTFTVTEGPKGLAAEGVEGVATATLVEPLPASVEVDRGLFWSLCEGLREEDLAVDCVVVVGEKALLREGGHLSYPYHQDRAVVLRRGGNRRGQPVDRLVAFVKNFDVLDKCPRWQESSYRLAVVTRVGETRGGAPAVWIRPYTATDAGLLAETVEAVKARKEEQE